MQNIDNSEYSHTYSSWLIILKLEIIIPSLTVRREKNGYKPSKYGRCSRFLFCIDMCYISGFFKIFVFFMIVRIEDFVIIS